MFSNHEIIILMTVHLGDISEKIIFDKNILDVRRENCIVGICYVIAMSTNNPLAYDVVSDSVHKAGPLC